MTEVDPDRSNRSLMVLAWSGPVGILLVLVGWMVLAGFLPPPSPGLGADAIKHVWSQHTTLKQVGMTMCIWGGTLYVPFTVAVGIALKRAGADAIYTAAQTALGVFGTVFFSLPFFIEAMVPFRMERPAESIQMINDIGMAMTFAPVAPFTFQYLAIALAVLSQRGNLLPRWVAWANFWVGFGLVPACMIPLVTSGPVAWNGLLSFWVPVAVFVAWYAVMFAAIRKVALSRPA